MTGAMKRREIACPVCDTDIPLYGDERPGDELHCAVCGVMSRLGKPSSEDEDAALEPDW